MCLYSSHVSSPADLYWREPMLLWLPLSPVMPLERTLIIRCSVALTITYLSDIHMHNSQPNPHGFGHPRSHDSLYQLSVDASTFLLRRQAHYSFIFLRSVQMIWSSRDGLAFSQLMV